MSSDNIIKQDFQNGERVVHLLIPARAKRIAVAKSRFQSSDLIPIRYQDDIKISQVEDITSVTDSGRVQLKLELAPDVYSFVGNSRHVLVDEDIFVDAVSGYYDKIPNLGIVKNRHGERPRFNLLIDKENKRVETEKVTDISYEEGVTYTEKYVEGPLGLRNLYYIIVKESKDANYIPGWA